jgi:hypothetical protein
MLLSSGTFFADGEFATTMYGHLGDVRDGICLLLWLTAFKD